MTAMRYLVHPDDVCIDRDTSTDMVIVRDEESEIVFSLPADFTDEQVAAAVQFANYAHSLGVATGRLEIAREVRDLIGAAAK